jgi:hypothetical protein
MSSKAIFTFEEDSMLVTVAQLGGGVCNTPPPKLLWGFYKFYVEKKMVYPEHVKWLIDMKYEYYSYYNW